MKHCSIHKFYTLQNSLWTLSSSVEETVIENKIMLIYKDGSFPSSSLPLSPFTVLNCII